jgi:hypothetical protein
VFGVLVNKTKHLESIPGQTAGHPLLVLERERVKVVVEVCRPLDVPPYRLAGAKMPARSVDINIFCFCFIVVFLSLMLFSSRIVRILRNATYIPNPLAFSMPYCR